MVARCLALCLLSLTLLIITACGSDPSPPSSTSIPTRYEGSEISQLGSLIQAGTIQLMRITPVAEKIEQAQPFGEAISFTLRNRTGQAQTFRIDCGTVIRGKNARFQDLIVSRIKVATIEANASWTGRVEVFSLQMRRHYPYQPAEYELGNLASGDLYRFMQCFCLRHPPVFTETISNNSSSSSSSTTPLPSKEQPTNAANKVDILLPADANNAYDLTPVQYAIWRIADNVNSQQLLSYAQGRGNPSLTEAESLKKQIQEQGQYTDQLLADCGITVKFLD